MHENRWSIVARVEPTMSTEIFVIMFSAAVHVLEALCTEDTKSKLKISVCSRKGFLAQIKSGQQESVGLSGKLAAALVAKGWQK
jgi:hypothetical protein